MIRLDAVRLPESGRLSRRDWLETNGNRGFASLPSRHEHAPISRLRLVAANQQRASRRPAWCCFPSGRDILLTAAVSIFRVQSPILAIVHLREHMYLKQFGPESVPALCMNRPDWNWRSRYSWFRARPRLYSILSCGGRVKGRHARIAPP